MTLEEYTLNIPLKQRTLERLWLQCGQKVTKTITYGTYYGMNLDLNALMVDTAYTDNWQQNKNALFV